MSEVSVAVDCRPADVQTHFAGMKRRECLFVAGEGVVDGEVVGFHCLVVGGEGMPLSGVSS